MASPFPPSSAVPGGGRIVVGVAPSGESALEALAYQYPLKLIAPAGGGGPDGPSGKSVLVFVLSYGGGLVAGDQVALDVDVQPGARLSLVTQGTTKVFKAPPAAPGGRESDRLVTRQTMTLRVAGGAALCLLPDPVQPFADSVYAQVQVVRLADTTASVCLLDWVIQGRAARGENWSLARWTGRNEVWTGARAGAGAVTATDGPGQTDRLLVRDTVLLAPSFLDDGAASAGGDDVSTRLRQAMHGLAVFGTLLLRGPLVDALGRFFLAEFAIQPRLGARDFRDASDAADTELSPSPDPAWRARRLQLEDTHGVLWSAAAVRGCVVVKFGARSVEGGRLWIGDMLSRERSVATVFGDQALMCVR